MPYSLEIFIETEEGNYDQVVLSTLHVSSKLKLLAKELVDQCAAVVGIPASEIAGFESKSSVLYTPSFLLLQWKHITGSSFRLVTKSVPLYSRQEAPSRFPLSPSSSSLPPSSSSSSSLSGDNFTHVEPEPEVYYEVHTEDENEGTESQDKEEAFFDTVAAAEFPNQDEYETEYNPALDESVLSRVGLDESFADSDNEAGVVNVAYLRDIRFRALCLPIPFDAIMNSSFLEYANDDDLIDHSAWFLCLSRLVDVEQLNGEEEIRILSITLIKLFEFFDTDSDGFITYDEMYQGLGLLMYTLNGQIQGREETPGLSKVTVAFDIMDVDGDGFLSRSELLHGMRTFLSLLLTCENALSGTNRLGPRHLEDFIEDMAQQATEQCLEIAGNLDEQVDHESFVLFAESYPDAVPWWNILSKGNHSTSSTDSVEFMLASVNFNDGEAKDNDRDSETFDSQSDNAFGDDNIVPLTIPKGDDDIDINNKDQVSSPQLTLDLPKVKNLMEPFSTQMDLEYLLRSFLKFSDDTTMRMDRPQFLKCLSGILSGGWNDDDNDNNQLDDDSHETSMNPSLANLYDWFDKNNDGYIDFDEFLAAMVWLSKGSQREKLTVIFHLFDSNGDGLIDREEMFRYFRSVIGWILTLGLDDPSRDERQSIDRPNVENTTNLMAFEATNACFDSIASLEEGADGVDYELEYISLEQFVDWFSRFSPSSTHDDSDDNDQNYAIRGMPQTMLQALCALL